nr:tail fiber domain-containing protein [uncultured Flavobacterium sp.]
MKNTGLLLLFLAPLFSYSQIGIGTTTPKAQLDITASNSTTPQVTDGLLVPRVAAFPLTNPSSEQQGMLIWLTTAVNSNLPGFYYWDNPSTSWKCISCSATTNNAWSVTGNANTTAQNFIGTTDTRPLQLRVNNRTAGKIDYGSPYNTSYGYQSLYSNTTGNSNTASGVSSLFFNTTGSQNTAYGISSLQSNTTGNFNTALGYTSGTFLASNVANTTSIGNGSGMGQGSNQISIGNASITRIAGQVTFGTYSDARIKENVKEDIPGLLFIKALRPVSYTLNVDKQNNIVANGKTDKETDIWEGKYDIQKIKQTGFIAQEVETAAKKINYSFNGVQAPQNSNGLYSVSYASFVVPLVKAVQEQQQTIEKLQEQNKKLEERLERIEKLIK